MYFAALILGKMMSKLKAKHSTIVFIIFITLCMINIELLYAGTFIHVKSKLYEADYYRKIMQAEGDNPDIILFINLTDKRREKLKDIFNVTNLVLKEESEKEFEIPYDKYGKKKKIDSKFLETIQLNGYEYSIFLIPHQKNLRKYTLEIYREVNKSLKPHTLKLIKLIYKKEIILDKSHIIGFFFNKKVYFLAFHFSISIGAVIY